MIILIYIGVGFGSYLQSFSDRLGRLPFFTNSILCQNIFGVLSALSWNFPIFAITRFRYGVAMGAFTPLASAYITEMVPESHRASELANTRYYWAYGSITTCVLAWIIG